MKVKILPYKSFSKSARALVNSLRPNAIMKKQRTSLVGRKKVLLNWGHSSPAFNTAGATILNKPEAVAVASNKLTALQVMKHAGVNVPEFTNDIETAKGWLEDERMVLARTMLRANSGRGIKVCKEVSDLIPAPLYVMYIRKEKEYRLHIFKGRVIDAVEKRRRSGFDNNPMYNKYIRSYEQGWIMARDNIVVSDAIRTQALNAVRALGLDFGAVDIVIQKRDDLPIVLEVNTAPGIMGTTLSNYTNAIRTWVYSL